MSVLLDSYETLGAFCDSPSIFHTAFQEKEIWQMKNKKE